MPDSQAKKDWIKNNTTYFSIKLNNNTDAALIAKLRSVKSVQGYIKELIKKDLENSQKTGS